MHCWHCGFDAVIVSRKTLAHIFGLSNFTAVHMRSFLSHITPYFKKHVQLRVVGSNTFFSVALSRVDIPANFGDVALHDTARASQWRGKGFKVAAISELASCHDTFSELDIVPFMSLIASGLDYPKNIKPKA